MNELPPLAEQNPAPAAAATPPARVEAPPPPPAGPSGERVVDFVQRPLTIIVIVLALLLALQAWSTHNRLQSLRQDMARSLQKGEVSNNETGTLARNVQELTKELQVKVGVLENRQTEAQSQQLALEQLYQDLSKNRDEWALAEIEQVL
jgi:uroporphyrin-3 C-methyltransferase